MTHVDHSSELTCVELAAGYCGLSEGLRRAGERVRLLAACEIEAFAVANLVAKMEGGLLDAAPVWSDCRTFPGREFRGRVGCLLGGYPCQPFSTAGRRRGHADPRNLWPAFIRIIEDMQPLCCFFENVAGHVSQGLRAVLTDLAALGYRVAADGGEPTWGLFSAAEIGASHARKRVFILAHTDEWQRARQPVPAGPGHEGARAPHAERPGAPLADAGGTRFSVLKPASLFDAQRGALPGRTAPELCCALFHAPGPGDLDLWARVLAVRPDLEPALCRVAHAGQLRHRVDRLRLAGNGVVPDTAALAWRTLNGRLSR